MARQRLRPEKIYSKDDLKAAQKVFREFCGDNSVMMEPFAAADLCAKIAQAIAVARLPTFRDVRGILASVSSPPERDNG